MYPNTITEVYDVICKYKKTKKITCLPRNYVNASFHQIGDGNQTSPPVSGTNGLLHRDVMCYNCDRPNHYSGQCPLPDFCKTGTWYPQLIYYFTQTTSVQKDPINPSWALLNSCSTISSIMNQFLLSYIKDCHPNTAICLFTNGGHPDYKKSITMDLFPLNFFYNTYYIVNILAIVDVTGKLRVTMDTNNNYAILIHTGPDYVLKFY